MFKPLHLLQVAILALVVSGCAARQPQSSPAPTQPGQERSQGTMPATAPSSASLTVDPQLQYPPIQSGVSTPGDHPWVLADGSLTPDVQRYAAELAQTRNIPLPYVQKLLSQAQYNAQAARLMAPSKTRIRRSWVTYKNRFVEPVRINAGERFWRENQGAVEQASKRYGVPASILVAIIGVETIYGRYTGSFRVLDALATLGFRYPDPSRPERSQLFRDQLADLIQLDYLNKLNALETTGSFAGAMGLPQFMPGSLMRYAADGNNDGTIDLHGSTNDALMSVARFLRLHGWVPGLPVFAPVKLPSDAAAFVDGGLEPKLDWATLQQAGATVTTPGNSPSSEAWKNYKLGVVNLVDEPRNQVEYRTGTPNFFAITHYNRSYFYAASVADLAQALSQRIGQDYAGKP